VPPAEKGKVTEPPATVEQLAKDVGKSSGRALKQVGEGVGGAAGKAWKCLTTLFTGC
jgi:hypothetical protein